MVELLAPAGTPDAFRAAIAAGADAVYVGLGSFNARAANAGLTIGELEAACVLAHSHGARVYVTLNVYVRDGELDDAVALAARALEAGADALIVADLGLIARLRAELPEAELHLSTQAGAQSAAAVRLAAREFGVERVTCARELSVAELAVLARTGVEAEAFCHGAICICYSGACSYSALLRGRSANRGDCTQPCRLAYELRDASDRVLAGGAWDRGRAAGARVEGDRLLCPRDYLDCTQPCRLAYELRDASDRVLAGGAWDRGRAAGARVEGDRLLCPRDYLGIRHIAEMLDAGISAFKVEGRMKSPDYVYNVVRCYRTALDAAMAGRPLGEAELDELESRLARSFSRGFTSAYLDGGHSAAGAGLMSVERAINQGLRVGSVARPCHEGAFVSFDRSVSCGDMLEIRSTPGPDAPADVPKRWPIVASPRDIAAGEEVLIPCKRKVEAGSAVHVVRSAGMIAETEAAVREMREEEVRLAVAESEGAAFGARLDAAEAGAGRGGVAVAESGADCAPAEPARFAHARRRRGNGRDVPGCDSVVNRDQKTPENGEKMVAKCQAVTAWQIATVHVVPQARDGVDLGAGCRRDDRADVEAAGAHGSRGGASAVVAHGSTPLMVTEHCLLTAEGPCSNHCPTCPRRLASQAGERFLRLPAPVSRAAARAPSWSATSVRSRRCWSPASRGRRRRRCRCGTPRRPASWSASAPGASGCPRSSRPRTSRPSVRITAGPRGRLPPNLPRGAAPMARLAASSTSRPTAPRPSWSSRPTAPRPSWSRSTACSPRRGRARTIAPPARAASRVRRASASSSSSIARARERALPCAWTRRAGRACIARDAALG